jgi:hypothetical protein
MALLLVNFAALYYFPPPPTEAEGFTGLWTPDDQIGWTYTPNWHGHKDYGWVNAEVKINSLGHRDDEPVETDARRILLLGDSMTFGVGLDQAETIDKQIEATTKGRINAYNTGLTGAGPAKILEMFRRCDWFHGTDVFYLFVPNDLNDSAMLKDCNERLFEGFRVRKTDDNGHVYSAEELRSLISRAVATPPLFDRVYSLLTLDHLRWYLSLFAYKAQGSLKNVDPGVAYTEEMRRLATERKMAFHVVLIPTKRDMRLGHYESSVEAYATKIRAKGLHVIEPIQVLSVDDYLARDGHVNAVGAGKVAQAIASAVTSSSTASQPAAP